jgi:molybdopterin synthase catalytic subunit
MRRRIRPDCAGSTVSVSLRFFARYAEVLGTDAVTVELQAPATVAHAVSYVRELLPNGATLPEKPLVAVNLEHVLPHQSIHDGDELAFLPPLAGG